MKLDSYLYEIRALLPEDWGNVDDRHIIRWMDLQRALWLKNELNKGRYIDDKIKQSIHIDTILVNGSEIPGIKANSILLKTTKPIPYTIIKHTEDTITSIHNPDILGERYNYVTKDEAIYSGSGKLNQADIFCFRYNGYIYIKCYKGNPIMKTIKNIVIEGVYENPLIVEEEYISPSEDFNYNNFEYPISEALWNYMKEQIINNGLITKQAEDVEKGSRN